MTDAPPPRYSPEWLARLDRSTVTPAEAGRVLGCSARQVIRLIKVGDLDGFRLSGRYHVRVVSLRELITPQ